MVVYHSNPPHTTTKRLSERKWKQASLRWELPGFTVHHPLDKRGRWCRYWSTGGASSPRRSPLLMTGAATPPSSFRKRVKGTSVLLFSSTPDPTPRHCNGGLLRWTALKTQSTARDSMKDTPASVWKSELSGTPPSWAQTQPSRAPLFQSSAQFPGHSRHPWPRKRRKDGECWLCAHSLTFAYANLALFVGITSKQKPALLSETVPSGIGSQSLSCTRTWNRSCH